MDQMGEALKAETQRVSPHPDAFERTLEKARSRASRQRNRALGLGLALTLALVAGVLYLPQGSDVPPMGEIGDVDVTLPGAAIAGASDSSSVALVSCASQCNQTDFSGLVSWIDASTGSLKGSAPIASPIDVGVADGSVWVASWSTGDLLRIDVSSGEVTQAIPLSLMGDSENGTYLPSGVATGEGSVWVTTARGQIDRFDEASGEKVDSASLPAKAPGDLAVAAGSVWMADVVGGLLQIPTDDLGHPRPLPISSGEDVMAVSVVAASDDFVAAVGVWAVPTDDGDYRATNEAALAQLDARTGQVISIAPVQLGSTLHSGDGDVWLYSEESGAQRLTGSGLEAGIDLPGELAAIAQGRLWAVDSQGTVSATGS